jgi:hypothetical protein
MAYMLDQEGPMPSPEEIPADREMIDRMRHDLERAQKAREYHGHEAALHREKANTAERCIKALSAALDLLEPPDVDPRLAKGLGDAVQQDFDPTRYRNG